MFPKSMFICCCIIVCRPMLLTGEGIVSRFCEQILGRGKVIPFANGEGTFCWDIVISRTVWKTPFWHSPCTY